MKISVLTPAFNSAPYLERAIQSVLAQNDQDFEHIVIDGGSKDETVAILKNHAHLKWVSEPDRGQSDAMNKAFARSTGEIIAYLNADDWFEPGVFAHVRDCFVNQPETDMVIGNLYKRYLGKTVVQLVIPKKDYRSTLLFFRYVWPLNPVSYFYRRTIQAAVGDFPLDEHLAMDYWLLIRAMAKARIQSSDLVFGTYFFPPESKTSLESGRAGLKMGLRRLHDLVGQHLREENPKLLLWFYAHWYFHYWLRKCPANVKAALRYMAYKPLFSKHLDYEEYRALGFRRACRKGLRGHH